jgi:hypothetical protein
MPSGKLLNLNKMRSLFLILCFFACLPVFSQSKKEIKVTKAKIAEMKTLSDIITDIPKDCKVTSFVFSANIGGSLKEFTCMGEGFSPEMKAVINTVEKGKALFIETIKSSCPKTHAFSYKITLE